MGEPGRTAHPQPVTPRVPKIRRRCRQLANQREKLLRAYYADAIDVAILKREQSRINAEVAEAELQLASDGEKLARAKEIIGLALDLWKSAISTRPPPRSASSAAVTPVASAHR